MYVLIKYYLFCRTECPSIALLEQRREERKKKKADVPIGDSLPMNESGMVELESLLPKK